MIGELRWRGEICSDRPDGDSLGTLDMAIALARRGGLQARHVYYGFNATGVQKASITTKLNLTVDE